MRTKRLGHTNSVIKRLKGRLGSSSKFVEGEIPTLKELTRNKNLGKIVGKYTVKDGYLATLEANVDLLAHQRTWKQFGIRPVYQR
jgi:hypothetical protein